MYPSITDPGLTWILRPETARTSPTRVGATAWGMSVDSGGRFQIHRAALGRDPVVTSYPTATEAFAGLPRPIALYLESHGQSMIVWSLDIALGRERLRARGSDRHKMHVAEL